MSRPTCIDRWPSISHNQLNTRLVAKPRSHTMVFATRTASTLICVLLALTVVEASTPPAPQWEPVGPSGGDQHLVFLTSKGTLLSSHMDGGVFRSEDQGQCWQMVRAVWYRSKQSVDVGFFCMAEGDGGLYAGGGAGLWFSLDDGKTWQRIRLNRREFDAEEPRYAIASIVCLAPSHLAIGCAAGRRGRSSGLNTVFEARKSKRWAVAEHPLPVGRSRGYVGNVVRLDYDDDFGGEPALFAASYREGLLTCRPTGADWKWTCTKAVRDPQRVTCVRVDYAHDAVYIGTQFGRIGRGTRGKAGWKWAFLKLTPPVPKGGDPRASLALLKPMRWMPSLRLGKRSPCVYALECDPTTASRIWWGCGSMFGPLYSMPATITCHGWSDWREGRWAASEVHPGSAFTIALRAGSPKQGKQGGELAVYVAQTGPRGIVRVANGGVAAQVLNRGLWAETVHRIQPIQFNGRPGVVSMGETSNEMSFDAGATWDPGLSFRLTREAGGHVWGTAVVPARYCKGSLKNLDALVGTGMPTVSLRGHGVFAMQMGKTRGKPALPPRLSDEPVADLVTDSRSDRYVFAPLQVGGVAVYDLSTQLWLRLESGLPGMGARYRDLALKVPTSLPEAENLLRMGRKSAAAGTVALAIAREGAQCAGVVSTVRGRLVNFKLYMAADRGALYRAMPLYEASRLKEDVTWERIDPPERELGIYAGVFLALSSSGRRLIALGSKGELLATNNVFAPSVRWHRHHMRQQAGTALSSVHYGFTGMVVRWGTDEVFVSSLHQGVLRVRLAQLFSDDRELTATRCTEGLGTDRILCVNQSQDGKWLLAGSQRMGVWRRPLP